MASGEKERTRKTLQKSSKFYGLKIRKFLPTPLSVEIHHGFTDTRFFRLQQVH
jgi:hypothetical protein